jgi:hypothetical protein
LNIEAAKEISMTSRAGSLAALCTTMLAAMLAAGTAFAQQPQGTVAKLKDVQGTVLVSQGDAMAAGAPDQRLPIGTRVVTTAGAKVTISYDIGCDITLNANERFTVRTGECAALMKEVVALGPAEGAIGGGTAGTATAAAGAAASGLPTLVGIGVVVGSGIYVYDSWKRTVVSPN